jgi:P4 family phage/plasmid primase-like protien
MNDVKKILKENYVDSVFHTHVSMLRPKGKYQFNRETLENFWKYYSDLIQDENAVIGIAEKPLQYLPVLADIDLRIKDNGEDLDSLYTEEQLKSVVSTYQSVLKQVVECTEEELTCVVLEKNLYVQRRNDIQYIKHGFHLHFPFIIMNKEAQEAQIIPRVQNYLKEEKLFQKIGYEDSGTVVDKASCTVPWLLYGSRKTEEGEPYKVTRIYNSSLQSIGLEKAFKNYQLFDNRERLIQIRGEVQKYLPRILSILPHNRQGHVKEVKKGVISPLKQTLKKERKSSATQGNWNMNVDEALAIAKELLPLLSDFRAEDRNEWMTIGWILYNISGGDGNLDGLDLWCEFSARCEEKYDENSCIYQWDRMVKKDYSIGTLKYFASIDNPHGYKEFKTKQSEKYLVASIDGSHYDIAKILYEEYGDEFVCASVANKIWYQFVNNKWEQIEEGVFLRQKISGKIIERYVEAEKKLVDDHANSQDKGTTAMVTTRGKQIHKLIQNLKNSGFKNNVMKEAADIFYDPRFKDRLDTDPYLFCFKNGVYDLKLNVFRPGRPEDFLSKSAPINYLIFADDDQRVHDVETFLEQVFPDSSVRKYFKDVASDIFVGGNHEKTVTFWTGEGDNGKSITQKFFEKMLGKFSIKMDTNNMTGKKPSAGAAYADLVRAGGGVRLITLEEPEGDECINSGTLKHWSGNDSYYARDLFEKGKDGREVEPLFKIVFVTNKLPRIRYADKAVWNRVRVVPFEATFCKGDNPAPDSYEEQMRQKRFPMDKTFGKKIPDMVEAFAWLLLEHRKRIANQPRIEPPKVLAATEIYRRQNDIYRQFMDECIIDDKNKIISLSELYSLFKEWYRESLPNQSVPVKIDVEDYFVKLWGSPEPGKKWSGYRAKVAQDDINKGNIILLDDKDLVDYSKQEKGDKKSKEEKGCKKSKEDVVIEYKNEEKARKKSKEVVEDCEEEIILELDEPEKEIVKPLLKRKKSQD